ncbi:glycosyltransferase family 4 protein [Halorubrum lipolyticum]|uniref:Group 1 glycosyl transferase n=1 Tax=Halorubrum lipolyticum DSM 21995 TaxID=1227482 RepID=M0NRU2_9EURY|nr:glycosyltransferase family 4 protein [Halorubrum lipolyticum]EMA59345.1 group 1 glycosyl transferase [Halorubrum lipolyticum DSM 21995]
MTDADDLTLLLMSGSWYPENAYMTLLADALCEAGVEVRTPPLPLFFPLTRAVLANPDADAMQLDWIYDYYVTTGTGVGPANALVSFLRAAAFLVDVALVSLLGVGVVRTVHNERHHEGLYPRTERLVNECVFAVADAITVKCGAAADAVAAAYRVPEADEITVVPDGNFVAAYENDVSREAARRDLGIDDDAFVVLFFGLIREYKGVPDLVEAFAGLDAPDAELWLVGNPHDDRTEAQVAALARSDPRIETRLEFVPDERIQYFLNAADALALPYRRILNSGTAHLGISYGRPVIAPAIGCLPETVPPENEFLYDPSDGDGLAEALRGAYDHPDLESIGRANHRHARSQRWAEAAASLSRIYREAADGDGRLDRSVGATEP